MTSKNYQESAIPYASVAALREAHTYLLKLSRNGESEEAFAEIEAFLRQAKATGALLDSEHDRALSQSLMDYWVTVLYRAQQTPPEATLDEFDPLLAPTLPDDVCPYMGLNAFEEQNNEAFFGRHAILDQMLGLLRENRLLYVVGPSGSGKSSLVLAGLVPRIRKGALPGSENWRCFRRMVPGVNPLRNLAITIGSADGRDPDSVSQQIQEFENNPNHLRDFLSQDDAACLLVIDQLEEVFTLCPDENRRQALIDNLVNAVRDPNARCTIILTMRTDFETQIVRFPELMSLAERSQVRVTPLTSSDLHDAIEQPAKRIGLRFEDGIVEELVRDILGEAAGLPLLQFALLSLWKARERNRITWDAFRKLGSARLALGRAADSFFSSLIVEDQWAAKGIFLRLVRPGELTQEFTSSRVRRESLYTEGVARDRIDRVLDKLITEGLVKITKGDVPLRDQVEVAHEALVRNWNTLAVWLDDERTKLRQRIRLTTAAEQWLEHGKDPGGLLRGVLLEEALNYTDKNEVEEAFVGASQAAVEQAQREKEEALERERRLDRERALAMQQRAEESVRHAARTRRFAAVLAVVAISAIAFGAFAAVKRRQAIGEGQRASYQAILAQQARDIANAQHSMADTARRQAVAAQNEAEVARQTALENLQQARKAQRRAIEAQRISEDQKRQITGLLAKATEQKNRADDLARQIGEAKAETEQIDELNRAATMVLRKPRPGKDELSEAVKKFTEVRRLYQKHQKRTGDQDTLSALVSAYRRLDDPENLQKKFNEAVQSYSQDIQTAAPGSGAFVESVIRLGDFYRAQSENEKAATLYTQQLNDQEDLLQLGKNDDYEISRVIDAYNQYIRKLDEVYRDQAKFRDIESLYQRSLLFKRRILKPDSLGMYAAIKDLANIYREQGKYPDAASNLETALSMAEKLFGLDDTTEVFKTLRDLGALHRDQARYDKAEPYYARALENLRNGSKKENIETLTETLNDLANVYRRLGKYEQSEALYQEAVSRYQQHPEKSQKKWITTQVNLAAVYAERQKFAESEKLTRQILTNLETAGKGQDNPEVANSLTALANIMRKLEKSDAAFQLYERALNIYQKDTWRFQINIAAIDINLALLQRQKGNNELVNEYYKKARAVNKGSIENLIRFFVFQNGYDAVALIYDQEIETRRKAYGQDSLATLETLNRAGRLFNDQRRYREAEHYYVEALDVVRKIYGTNDSVYLVESLNNLARVYQRLKKYEQAEPLYKEALCNLEANPKRADPLRTAETLENYAEILDETGRHPEAATLKERAKALRTRRQAIDG